MKAVQIYPHKSEIVNIVDPKKKKRKKESIINYITPISKLSVKEKR